jgi:DNA-binding NtrC family response regulator
MYQPEIERISEELYFIAASPATRRLRTQAELLSQTDVPVLITGEAGSGKTTAARLIHSLSIRSSFPFMRVKCAVLTSDLLENELFGYEHTSANGRPESTLGKFEQCAKGTILLDEFDAMPGAVQQRLLKLLETGEFVRCGGQNPIRADVRIIAATCGDLELAAAEKRVHEELFYRLSVFELRVPPLRQRHEEIPLLLGHLMNRLTRRYGVPAPRFSSVLLDACQQYAWPGNLRELENFAKRFLAHGEEDAALHELHSHPDYAPASKGENGYGNGHAKTSVHPSSVYPSSLHTSEETSSLKLLVRNAKGEAERGAIAHALEQTHWNRKAAARLLNVSYRALLYKIQEYHMAPPAESARLFLTDGVRKRSSAAMEAATIEPATIEPGNG